MRLSLAIGSVVALAVALPAAAATRTFTVTSFDRIRMSGPFKVTLATGPGSSAHAEGDPSALDRVHLEVQDRTLVLQVDRTDAATPGESTGPVTVMLTTPSLASAFVLGPGTLAVDKVAGGRVDLTLSGSGRIVVGSLSADLLNLLVAGSGGVTLAGRTAHLRLVSQGAGSLDLAKLTSEDADLSVNGTGDVTVTATRAAKGTADGSGNLVVLGPAACAIAANGVGTVRCEHTGAPKQ